MVSTGAHIPQFEQFNVLKYLERIHCPASEQGSVRYLKMLHKSHLMHIPFENLDNFQGKQILLDIDKVYEKLILSGRGGFCYELNSLFNQLLIALGFKTRLISARVFDKAGQLGPEFDHMAIMVRAEKHVYLVDVGFGISFLQPLRFAPNEVQMDQNKFYRIVRDIDDNYYMQSSKDSLAFKNEYQFTLKRRSLVEFVKMCEYHNRDPKSQLTKSRFINQFTPTGRITVRENMMHILEKGTLHEIPISNTDDFYAKVAQHFGIDMSNA